MNEQPGPEFTDEERRNQAAGNAWALYTGIIEYLREQGQSPQEFMQWLGERNAPGWESARDDMEKIAHYVALNPVSLGAGLESYTVDKDEAEIRLTAPPTVSDTTNPETTDLFSEVYRPIMEHLDLDYDWEREGDQITYRLKRRDEG